MIKNWFLLVTVIVNSYFVHAQQDGGKLPDSLEDKSFSYFHKQVQLNEKDTTNAIFYIDAWLSKAKTAQNLSEIVKAYNEKIYLLKGDLRMQYADSAVAVALKTKSSDIIGEAYSVKGSEYYYKRDYSNALDTFLKAIDYVSKTDDESSHYFLKYAIATIKSYLGFYQEALRLFKDCEAYYKKKNDYNHVQGYLNSVHSIGVTYRRLGEYQLASQTNNFGMEEGVRLGDRLMDAYFIQSEGINQYFKKNYIDAIFRIKSAEKGLAQNHDFGAMNSGHFYLAKSHWALGEHETALVYFRKVDQAFADKNYMHPDFREGYEMLVKYYKEEGDVVNQLRYINRLIKADSVLNVNFKNMSAKMHKDYDTKALYEAKLNAEEQLANKEMLTYVLYAVVCLFFFTTLYAFYRHYTNQKLYHEKLEAFINQNGGTAAVEEPTPAEVQEKKPLEINAEVINKILAELDKFEARKKFLKKDVTIVDLSTSFGTNSNYLSKVIQHYRNKNFTRYLSDLRIDYITALMRNETKYRNYTIKALADEAGFSTPQHFSKAFFAVHGFYPSLFLSELGNQSA